WLVAHDYVGWGLDPAYPNQEGSFFGNIFITGGHGYTQGKGAAFYCNGKAYDKDTVPGRIGANQVYAPYTDPIVMNAFYQNYTSASGTSYCSDYCTPADGDDANSGYKACGGWNNVITTYRKVDTDATGAVIPPTVSTVNPPTLTASITKYLDTPLIYCANV